MTRRRKHNPKPAPKKIPGLVQVLTTADDNETHDIWYTAIFTIGVMTLGLNLAAFVVACIGMYLDAAHHFEFTGIAAFIAASGTAFAASAGAAGLGRKLDPSSPTPPPAPKE